MFLSQRPTNGTTQQLSHTSRLITLKTIIIYYSHIFPESWAQHCNYATLLAGRSSKTASGSSKPSESPGDSALAFDPIPTASLDADGDPIPLNAAAQCDQQTRITRWQATDPALK